MIFDSIALRLQNMLSESEYSRYIKQMSYDEKASKSDLAVFEVPNPFIASWIKTKYCDKIADLFQLESSQGIRPTIEIRLKSAKKRGRKKSETIIKEQQNSKSTILNPSYTFESFIVGSSNQFPYTISTSICDNPGSQYNPVFIYGGVGLGKTHLIQAIGNRYTAMDKVVIYATFEQFLNDFTDHLRTQTMDRFRDKYRSCDLLIIDDIQFISGKEKIQEEFFHTFNQLHADGKQIVIAADKAPKEIIGLEDRLKSRFIWGQVCDIQPPELETKIAIIRKKCELDQINLNNEVIHYIATHMDENIREIEGTIIKLNGFSKMIGTPIDLDFTKNVLKDQINEKRENITIDQIVEVVSRELNVKPSEIKSKSRVKAIVNARRTVIYLARNLTPNSMPMIANYFSMKDHSAVSKAMSEINKSIDADATFKAIIDEISNKISKN
jgi:chromosomal replication initiator protein